ncbi:hypothetical protein PR048_030672 [Dryococelus australis]|uniref:DDE-1 domain-containing protein n=1 Tax=Dryococelus australis TaxID=614101 RepID=A0ABQ9G9M9_9NEOP|nr:hypothetical protein PR048_030672 [Dryococelus australis]
MNHAVGVLGAISRGSALQKPTAVNVAGDNKEPGKKVKASKAVKWENSDRRGKSDHHKTRNRFSEQLCYGIPYATLHDRLKSGYVSKLSFGRPPIFNTAQEKEIADHVILLSKFFYDVMITDLRKLAFSFAENLQIPHNFCRANKLAGSISFRKPQATSINRITAFNKDEVKHFYDNLEGLMVKFKFSRDKIFNVNETGTAQIPGKRLAKKGEKRVETDVRWERGRCVTAVCAMSASGSFVPPMSIYPWQRLSKIMKRDGPPGWINEELFLAWLPHFSAFCKPDPKNPVLLVLDNHSSHISLESYDFCRQNGIIMLSLPPHTSHRMQCCFLCTAEEGLSRWMVNHPHQKFIPDELSGLFNIACVKMATIEKAVNGFRKTGIFPMDSDTFAE